jgi:hypothetical protein
MGACMRFLSDANEGLCPTGSIEKDCTTQGNQVNGKTFVYLADQVLAGQYERNERCDWAQALGVGTTSTTAVQSTISGLVFFHQASWGGRGGSRRYKRERQAGKWENASSTGVRRR